MGIIITYSGLRPENANREMNKAVADSLSQAAGFWWRQYLPFHFEEFSGAKYGYKKRTKAYTKRKLNKYGHTKPLVYSGNFKMLATSHFVVGKKSINEATIKIKAPNYVWITRNQFLKARKNGYTSAMPNMYDETIKTIASEEKKIGEFFKDKATEMLNNINEKSTKKI